MKRFLRNRPHYGIASNSRKPTTHKRHRTQLQIEQLEPRLVLSATPLITEFMAANSTTLQDGDGDYSDWIEIHNPDSQPVDLTGWQLTDNDGNLAKWAFPDLPQSTIAANGYLVVFASGQATDNYVDLGGNLHTNFKLGASGEYLALSDGSSTVVSEYAPEFPPQTDDQSYGLDASLLNTYFTNATPGAVNDYASAFTSRLQITEIMYHPSSNDPLEEYIEIYNAEPTTINLTGWQFSNGVNYAFPDISLDAGEYLVIAADTATFSAKYPSVTNVIGGWEGQLSDGGETLTIEDSFERTIDSVTYADEGQWATRELGPLDHGHRGWIWSDQHDGLGSSLELVSTSLTNTYGQNWLASNSVEGTPGEANSVVDLDDDVAPLIVEMTQFPVIPSSTDPVVISARLIDETTVGDSARLMWRVDGAASFQTTAMADDGTGADATAGDSVFTATIPPQANGTVIEFYLESEDENGNLRTYPSVTEPSGTQLTNLLYQVDDSFDPNTLPAPGDAPTYRLIMTEAERFELEQLGLNSNEAYSHAQMNGTFIAATDQGVDVRYNVGIRNRGQSSRTSQPNSYHVNIPSDVAWQGIDAFNLNTQFTPLQLAGLRLFQATGGVGEDGQAVSLRVNGNDLSLAGSPSYGTYIQVETANSDFATNHFPADDNGNLYRIVRSNGNAGGDLDYLGTDPESYRPFYDKKTNSGADDFSDLIQLTDILNNAPDSLYYEQVQQVVDVSDWVNYFAVNAILGNQETTLATGVGDDYLLYRGVDDPRFVLIAHDWDSIFGLGDSNGSADDSIYDALDDPTIARFLNHPEIITQYHNRLVELLNTTFSNEQFNPFLDELLTDFAPPTFIADMKTFIDARRQHILDELQQPLTASSPLMQQSGLPRTVQDTATLEGTASLAGVGSILVNGELAEWDPLTGDWSIGEATGGQSFTLINPGSSWDYLDAGQVPSTTPGNDWRVDDPNWTDSGDAQLGYGDNDETTTVDFIDTDPGQSGTQKNITTYFRRTFSVTDASAMESLLMRLLVDDGAVVYLNGIEVERPNMPDGVITSTTEADVTVSGSAENIFYEYSLDTSVLVEGENVIAVEVHQTGDDSSDISFDMELIGSTGVSYVQSGFDLLPGINRVAVDAFAGPGGTGELVDSVLVDIWYDDGDHQIVGGAINTDTTWTAAAGPYVVTSDITVDNGATLTIEPGTSVFFDSGTGLTVSGSGRIVAEGTESARIRFAANPLTSSSDWEGLNFINSASDNRLTYIDISGGDGQGEAVFVDHATVLFDNAAWFDINDQVFDLEHPTMIVRNSSIPSISGDETVHLFGLNQGEQLIFEHNTFGKNLSGDDVVDLGHDTTTPATIVFRGNYFMGGLDDGIDTDGFPVLIENNIFTDFHLNTSRPTTSNAVSSGHVTVGGNTISSDITLVGNYFYDNDHHLLLKDFSYANVMHNTMVGATLSAIQFTEVGGSSVIGPGLGADLDSNIIWDSVETFTEIQPETQLTVNRSILPAELLGLGVGNLPSDPLLVDPANGDFTLLENSPAIGTGDGGTEIGAFQLPGYTLADASSLKITELHYHPQAGQFGQGEVAADADLFEFVELQNTSANPIDLSGVAFTDGFDYTFPFGTSLEAGELLVLASNADIFASRYGQEITIAGVFQSNTRLSNGGETLRIADASGTTIIEFDYDDESGWPVAADGDGSSLMVIDTGGNYDLPTNWYASYEIHGTPGTVGQQFIPADFDHDLDVDATDLSLWQAGYGTTTDATHSSGDADLDQNVDGFDFLAWQRGFTNTVAQPANQSSEQPTVTEDLPSAQPSELKAVNRPELIDAAIALSLYDSSSNKDEISTADEAITFDLAWNSFSRITPVDLQTVSNDFASDIKTRDTRVDDTSDSNTQWINDELLERVFG